jgi:hypothetical protein
MRIALSLAGSLLISLLACSLPARAQTKKDYLTEAEADKIRDAETPAARIKLFVAFAADKIKKLQYELAHPDDTLHRDDRLNALINAYTGCMDDGADLIDIGVEKQEDIHDGIKDMQSHAPEFLTYLKGLTAKGKEVEPYRDNLDDAIDATNDAIKSADEASKEITPPPVRHNPA